MAREEQLYYVDPEGNKYPLFEADYDYKFTTFKTDWPKSIVGDPRFCFEALGIRHDKNVIDVWVGSGKVAYIVFKPTNNRPFKHALRFSILAKARAMIDANDVVKRHHRLSTTKKSHYDRPTTTSEKRDPKPVKELREKGRVELKFSAPTQGRTRQALKKSNKERARKIKAGTHVPKASPTPARPRMTRVGSPHRPKPTITGNIISATE